MIVAVEQQKELNSYDNQKLPDKDKTIITAVRKDHTGKLIHKAELTLVSFGDIEESCYRFATALFKKINTEEAGSSVNVNKRVEKRHNRPAVEKITGVKIGGYYPLAANVKIAGFSSVGFNMRLESQKFFIEFGANGRIPGSMEGDTRRYYAGAALEIGGSYFLTHGLARLYAGAGVIPHLNIISEFEMGIAPYLQVG